MTLHRLATALPLAGALLTLPAGAVVVYTVYQTQYSTAATCRALRGAILPVLDKPIAATAKRALVHKDLTEFERVCALNDPDAKAVFAAFDRAVLFAVDPDANAASRPVRFVPPPFPGRPGEHPLQQLFERLRQRPFRT
jgi:hypothetical protein